MRPHRVHLGFTYCALLHVVKMVYDMGEAWVQAARAEAAAWAVEYQPSWTYQDDQGASQGPLHLAELKLMLAK